MSNVLYFQQALAARNAFRNARTEYAAGNAGLRGFGAVAYSEKVKQAQIALTFVGFPTGVADGIWGPNTLQGASNFRAAAGLDPDPPTLDPVGRSMPQPVWFTYLDAAFDRALGNAVARAKGQQQATAPGAALAPSPGMAPQATQAPPGALLPPPGTTASLPLLEAAKQWLLAPGQPVYKKPVLYIGAGVIVLTIILALRSRD